MTDYKQHPIIPPPELLDKWDNLPISTQEIFILAAQWGADQELEACCEVVRSVYGARDFLQSARRPKPPGVTDPEVVWDAYEHADCDEFRIDPRRAGLAAALEAAVDQVVPEEVHPQVYEDCCDYAGLRARMSVRTRLLAIAAELRGT